MGPSRSSLGLRAALSHTNSHQATAQDTPTASGWDFRLSNGKTLETTQVFEDYWQFACERQEIFYRRLEGEQPPWTDDGILRTYRFTNVYRASDRVSQFLIRNVVYLADQAIEEVFFRVMLFKLFNRIETWMLLTERLGPPAWKTFDFDRYNSVLESALYAGETLYSSAYIMPNPPFGRSRKHANHLILLARMMHDRVPHQVASATSLQQVFELLRSFPSLGDFLAFQYSIDLNYSEIIDFSEMEYVVAGPGARSGIRKAFVDSSGLSDEELIREITYAAPEEFARRGLTFRTLGGRPLQLVDCQNLFCEIDKYSRVARPEVGGNGRTRIKRRFSPASTPVTCWYPPKWQLPWPERQSSTQSVAPDVEGAGNRRT
jgi:hypothetical protein